MKKVAIVCKYDLKSNRIGGMDRFYTLFDKKLKAKGFEVDWYFSQYEAFSFYEHLTISSSTTLPLEQNFLSAIEHKPYDIIITHFTELCTSFYKKIKQKLPKSYVIAVDHNPRPLQGFSLKKRLKKRLEGFLFSKYIDRLIGVSQYTVHHILKDYGSFLKAKTQVVYNGIDTNVFVKRTNDNKNRFIVASHLRQSKGIQDLLKALSLLDSETINTVVIDVYGEGPYKKELVSLTQQYGLTSYVTYKGNSPRLNELFCDYNFMIQPTYMECFSLSILESLSANVPVITTPVGGNLEVIKDNVNGFVYKTGDSQQLAVILDAIINGKKSITEDTSLLIEAVYSIENMVNNHLKLLP